MKSKLPYSICILSSLFMVNWVFAQISNTTIISGSSGSILSGTSGTSTTTTINSGVIDNTTIGSVLSGSCFWDTDWSDDCLDEITIVGGYEFFIDEEGRLMYGDASNPCSAQEIYCVSLCSIYEYDWQNVIAASASTFSNQISIDEEVKSNYGIGSRDNTVETGEAGKWYLQSQYVYKTDLTTNELSFKSGVFEDFYSFNWSNSNQLSSHWILTNENTSFSPDGHILEAENAIEVKSAEKFGYQNNFVYTVANNASFESVLFESFEVNYGASRCGDTYCFEEIGFDDHALSDDYAHSGSYSIMMDMEEQSSSGSGGGMVVTTTTTYEGILELAQNEELTSDIKNSGLIIKVWVRYSGSSLTITLQDMTSNILDDDATSTWDTDGMALSDYDDPKFDDVEFEEVARSGDWILYQAIINPDDFSSSGFSLSGGKLVWSGTDSDDNDYGLQISFEVSSSSLATFGASSSAPSIYVDDVRVQPLKSKMLAYVYDPTSYRLLTEFDDQHFGMYYQYNDEGKLIRKKKETIRGMKTLSETHYHLPETDRE